MGCFSKCFRKSKGHRRTRREPIKASPSLLDQLQKYESVDDFILPQWIEEEEEEKEKIEIPSPKSNDERVEKGNLGERKKVTFDLNVKIYEPIENEQDDEEVTVNDDDLVESKKEETGSDSISNSSTSSVFSYPLNHRYQNCMNNDVELDEMLSSDESENGYYTDEDEDEDQDDFVESDINREKPVINTQDESSESLFSVSLDSKKHNSGEETGDNKEVNSPMLTKIPKAQFDRVRCVNSVLNPIENVAQWKVVKAKSKLGGRNLESKENHEKEDKEIGVDTSLSSWLKLGSETGASATTPNSNTSSVSVGNSGSLTPNKFEDRPILGALTLEEIRQFSASSSPRKSPGFSPDDKPIIGSVGSYWSHSAKSGSSTKSRTRFAENEKVKWDSTPFETRLEIALEEAGLTTDEQSLGV